MTDRDELLQSERTLAAEPVPDVVRFVPFANVIWLVLGIAFLAFLAIGDVPARVWRTGKLHVEWKPVRRIWEVQIGDLPQVHYQFLMDGAFIGSLIVFVVGVLVAIRLLLTATPVSTAGNDGA